ncbi:MAG: hypothetical protein J6X62_04205 [Bacteroidales bacterium]|nr:hypothetical protein [Bacteroidales bacterium]
MKTTRILILMVAVAVLCSCGNNRSHLKPGKAASIVQNHLASVHLDDAVMAIPVGLFECESEYTRYQLRCLAANGLIKYECSRVQHIVPVVKTRQVKQKAKGGASYTNETYMGEDTVWSHFVKVELTDAGRNLLSANYAEGDDLSRVDIDLVWVDDTVACPESAVEYYEYEDEVYFDEEDTFNIDELAEELDDVEGTEAFNAEYLDLKAKETIDWVALKAYRMRAVKVRNLQVFTSTPNDNTYPKAEGELVMEVNGVTPVGRILGGFREGQRFISDCSFNYYEGEKWQLGEIVFGDIFNAVEHALEDLDEVE